MATLKILRRRVVSVKNTQKITKAMKLVSAAKLRRAQSAAEAEEKLGFLINAYSGPPRSPIPDEGDQRFRSMAITRSGPWRSPIPEHGDHLNGAVL